jgi:putative oxidoreductase
MGTDLGRLVLRAAVGGIFVEHGTQKLFGWFGGHGPDGTGGFFESIGLRPGRRNAIAAGVAEAGGGALVALGLATQEGAAAIGSVMVTALRTVVWSDGIKVGTGGYELLLLANAVGLADLGPGRFSLDALLGSERRGAKWGAAVLGAAVAGSALAVAAGRRMSAPPAEDTSAQEEREESPAPAEAL